MKTKIKFKQTEMGVQLLSVANSIATAIGSLLGTIWGKLLIFAGFIAITFGSISAMIHIVLIICLIDMIMGCSVVIYKKGWGHILSSKLRDTLIKAFFYVLLLMLLFLIETQLVDGYYFTSKAAFAMISGVELLSITASMLILFPNFPVLKLLKKVLTKEMAKKLGLTEEEVKDDIEASI